MKRGAPLKRYTPLARSPMKRRKVQRDNADPRWLAFVRSLPCCAPGCTARPPSEAHHKTGAGMARKATDRETMPLCSKDHRALHEFTGPFRGWSRQERAAWQDAQIAIVEAMAGRKRDDSRAMEGA